MIPLKTWRFIQSGARTVSLPPDRAACPGGLKWSKKVSMKTFFCLLAFALVLGQAPCLRGFGVESVSPDGQWRVANVGFSLQLFDRTGRGGLILELDIAEAEHVEASWSPDSQRVVVAVDTRRNSTILAAWREGNAWQKAVQAFALPNLDQLTQQNGPLLSEQRMPGDWHSADRVTVHGYLVFQNRKVVTYGYDLKLAPEKAGGGGQPGALVADNYRTP
jgi:hypothetical protein